MKLQMEKANLLAENLKDFTEFVNKIYNHHSYMVEDYDKLYRLKNLVEESNFNVIADELIRINTFAWDEKVTILLLGRVKTKIAIIDEYVNSNQQDLYLFSARIYSIKGYCESI